MNLHAFGAKNWRKNDRGFRLIDYGDSFGSSGFLISSFLVEWHMKIAGVLVATAFNAQERNN